MGGPESKVKLSGITETMLIVLVLIAIVFGGYTGWILRAYDVNDWKDTASVWEDRADHWSTRYYDGEQRQVDLMDRIERLTEEVAILELNQDYYNVQLMDNYTRVTEEYELLQHNYIDLMRDYQSLWELWWDETH